MGTTRLLGVRGALAAALLLAGVMLVLAAASAEAAFQGEDGKIAFSRENFRQGTSGIFTVAPEGGAQERIGPEYGYSPSWSADGQKVVFVAYSGENERDFEQDIYVMDDDGTNVQRVTNSRAYESSPSFFPGGDKIAFARYSNRNGADVFTMKLDGTGRAKLTDDPGFFEESLAVSPNGEKIAFTRYNRSSEIFVMDADGTDPVNLTKTGRVDEFGTDWSPDGRKIAFTSYRFSGREGLAARAAESQEEGAFTPEALTPGSLAREASESKDHSGEFREEVEVSVMNANGTKRKDLTTGRAYDVLPAFSPSGDEIVFSRMIFDRRSEESELFVMGSNGADKRQITNTPRAFEYEADWQPLP